MHEQILSTLGLALRAGRLEVGEEPVGGACRAHIARLIVVAADAASNTHRRAQHFGESWNVMCLPIPFQKDELGRALGRSSCAVAAVTDPGFALSVVKKLTQADPDRYTLAAQELAQRLEAPRRHIPPPPRHIPPAGPPPGARPKSRSKPRPAAPPAAPQSKTAAPPKPKTSSKPGAASKPKTPPGPKPGSSRGGGRGGFGPGPKR